jgi:hypothetical protein
MSREISRAFSENVFLDRLSDRFFQSKGKTEARLSKDSHAVVHVLDAVDLLIVLPVMKSAPNIVKRESCNPGCLRICRQLKVRQAHL